MNRLLVPTMLEAVRLVERGDASSRDGQDPLSVVRVVVQADYIWKLYFNFRQMNRNEMSHETNCDNKDSLKSL